MKAPRWVNPVQPLPDCGDALFFGQWAQRCERRCPPVAEVLCVIRVLFGFTPRQNIEPSVCCFHLCDQCTLLTKVRQGIFCNLKRFVCKGYGFLRTFRHESLDMIFNVI